MLRIFPRSAAAIALAWTLVIGGAAAPAAFELASSPVQAQPQPTPTTTVLPDGPQPLGVVIRLYATGPEFHRDADHWQSGIDTSIPPSIDSSGFLVIHTTEKNAVVSCTAHPDETLVARGITAGCSNGSHLVRFLLVKPDSVTAQPVPLDLNNPIHYSRVSGPYSNLWVDIIHDGSWAE